MTDLDIPLELNAIRKREDSPYQIEMRVGTHRAHFTCTAAARDFARALLKISNIIDRANTGEVASERPRLRLVRGS